MTSTFQTCSLSHGRLIERNSAPLSCTLSAWQSGSLELPQNATHFGFVVEGSCRLRQPNGEFHLQSGMYFALPGSGYIEGSGRGIVVSRWNYHGFFHVGGPIEARGRLEYIDGCSDSLLIAPVVKGDPCLNLLHIPPGVDQTVHTHPSDRMGVVVRGAGLCRTPSEEVPLAPGLVWLIEARGLHSFHTTTSELTIIAFHPDSEFGPTDNDHPMLNRTLIDGNPDNRVREFRETNGGATP